MNTIIIPFLIILLILFYLYFNNKSIIISEKMSNIEIHKNEDYNV
jgi:hypothetical protein